MATVTLGHRDITVIFTRLADSPPRCEDVPPQKYFTLNANIEPFDPFIIKHDLSAGLNLNRYSCCVVFIGLYDKDFGGILGKGYKESWP